MHCCRCGKPALQYVKEEEERVLAFCADCYRDYCTHQGGTILRCPSCQTTMDDFKKTGLLGCAECYQVFRNLILPTVNTVQGSVQHEGKEPVFPANEEYDLQFEQEHLQKQIERAMKEKDYNEATRLQKKLLQLHQLTGGKHGND